MGIQINGQTDTISATDGSLNIAGTVAVNVTGDATGLTGTPDITVGTVNASSAVISGDLTVNGTTTTLDTLLTEVDKLEVGANNTNVAVAVTQSGTGDILRLYDGATQVVTVKDGGSVGIGTDNPATALDISGNIRLSASDANIQLNDGGPRLRVPTDNTLTIHTGGNLGTNDFERLRIDSSGNVGIGTDNPQEKLEIEEGNIRLSTDIGGTVPKYAINWTGGGAGQVAVFSANTSTGEVRMGADNDSGTYFTTLYSNGDEKLRIDSSGNVGIGTDNPVSAKLHVQDGGIRISGVNENILKIRNDNATYDANISQTSNGDLRYRYGPTETLRITSSGNVGIGLTNPSTKLHLSSGTATQIIVSNTSSSMSDGDTMGTLDFAAGPSHTVNARIAGAVEGTSEAGGDLVFETRADGGSLTEKLRIDASGNVTIPNIPLLKTNAGNVYGSSGSLTTSPLPATAILQSAAEIDRGNNGWTTTGSNAYTFVCPVTGIYAVHAHMSLDDIAQGNRIIFTMAYTLGGGNLPLNSYVEVMDVNMDDYMNYSYYNTWNFTAGTRVGFGINGTSGTVSGINGQWGIHLIA